MKINVFDGKRKRERPKFDDDIFHSAIFYRFRVGYPWKGFTSFFWELGNLFILDLEGGITLEYENTYGRLI